MNCDLYGGLLKAVAEMIVVKRIKRLGEISTVPDGTRLNAYPTTR
jgi:hypothetical protein